MKFILFIKRLYVRTRNLNKNVHLKKASNIGIHSTFEGNNVIGSNSSFTGGIGRCSYIGDNCSINAQIGRYVSIASNVTTILSVHPTDRHVSTSPVFYSVKRQCGMTYVGENRYMENKYAVGINNSCKIGNDVWIGFGVTIMPGITIGDGAIVAANATVTKDVRPYTIVGGCPAKLIRNRFDDSYIDALLQIKWWTWSEKDICKVLDEFEDVEVFIERFKSGDVKNV